VLAEVATDYIFFCSSRYAADQGDATTFAYLFTQLTNFNIWPDVPQCATQVCHGDELAYVFNTATNIAQSFTPDEEALSLAMVSYWAGFAEPNHDPNSGGTTTRPPWPAFPGRKYLVLDTPISTVTDPDHNCPLWDGIGYEVVSGTVLLEGGGR
jgi:carboxylesterase type B